VKKYLLLQEIFIEKSDSFIIIGWSDDYDILYRKMHSMDSGIKKLLIVEFKAFLNPSYGGKS